MFLSNKRNHVVVLLGTASSPSPESSIVYCASCPMLPTYSQLSTSAYPCNWSVELVSTVISSREPTATAVPAKSVRKQPQLTCQSCLPLLRDRHFPLVALLTSISSLVILNVHDLDAPIMLWSSLTIRFRPCMIVVFGIFLMFNV